MGEKEDICKSDPREGGKREGGRKREMWVWRGIEKMAGQLRTMVSGPGGLRLEGVPRKTCLLLVWMVGG